MRGLFGRFRAWLGSVLGGGSDDENGEPESGDGQGEAAGEAELAGDGPPVAHRDDRPLKGPDPEVLAARAEADEAEAGNVREYVEPDVEFEVSIRDAETGSERGTDASGGDNGDLVCAVCGTDVEDPDGGCPLCGSTELRRV
jgi:hypothetical protein